MGAYEPKALVLSVSFGMLGNSRKISTKGLSIRADPSMLSAHKKLLLSPELDAIRKHDTKVKSQVLNLALPGPLKDGFYNVPKINVLAVTRILENGFTERSPLIDLFIAFYDERTRESIARLGDLGNKLDYRSRDVVRSKFTMEWNWLEINVPEELKSIRAGLYLEEQEKLRKEFEGVAEAGKQILRSEFTQLVDRAVDSLLGVSDGKRKKFYASSVTSVEEFLKTFEDRNIANDKVLQEQIARLKNALVGFPAERIREDADVRNYVGQRFQEIRKDLSGMMGSASRVVVFDEEE